MRPTVSEFAARLFVIQRLKREEKKLKNCIKKRRRVIDNTISPIVRFRLENEVHSMTKELDTVESQMLDVVKDWKQQ